MKLIKDNWTIVLALLAIAALAWFSDWSVFTKATSISSQLKSEPTPMNWEYRDKHGGLHFGAYTCTEDCSGHWAGYNWAMDKNLSEPNKCDGTSQSFIEGCLTRVEEVKYFGR